MSFRLGLVGLCTSHPQNWLPVIRQLNEENIVDVEVAAVWDSGETRPAGFAEDFARQFAIPHIVENLNEMPDLVDGVIVHTANWNKHIEQAGPFIEADKSVLLDKPMIGNMKDANQLLDWAAQGKCITGGSSLRFAEEIKDFNDKNKDDIKTVFTACLTDDYNYGIHFYSLVSGLLGSGIKSVKYIGGLSHKLIELKWSEDKRGLISLSGQQGGPFKCTVVTEKKIFNLEISIDGLYKSFLKSCLPYICGLSSRLPVTMQELIECESAALAAKKSWQENGREIFLTDLDLDTQGYDGYQFAQEYRRSRF